MKINTEARENAGRLNEILTILKKHDIIHGLTPEKLRLILEDLGPTYIKMGQIMSMREDMLPHEYCEELQKLRANVPPMTFETIQEIVEEELNHPLEEMFASVDENPLGSASVAQAHAAVLKNGENVVIKVQRKGLYKTMERDIALLKRASSLLNISEVIGLDMNINVLIDELWRALKEELDFGREAANLIRFRENQKDVDYVTSPAAYPDYSTRHILTMSRVTGVQIDDTEGIRAQGCDPHDLGLKLAQNYCKQVLTDHFYHGDPHPGNIQVMDGKIAWLDLGMMGTVSAAMESFLTGIIKGILSGDMLGLTDAIFLYCQTRDDVERTAFARKVEGIVQRYKAADFGQMDVGELIQEVMDCIRGYNIRIPDEMMVFSKSLMTIEGTLKVAAPEVNLLNVLTGFMRQKLTSGFDPQKQLEEVSQQVLRSAQKAMNIPSDLTDVIKLLRDGDLSVRVETSRTQRETRRNQRNWQNAILSVFVTAFYLLGGLTVSADTPGLLGIPWISLCSVVCGTALLAFVLIDLWKQRKEDRQ